MSAGDCVDITIINRTADDVSLHVNATGLRTGQSQWDVVVDGAAGRYRDYTLFMQDEDTSIGTHRMPYTCCVQGPVGINYRVAGRSFGSLIPEMSSDRPETPLLEGCPGEAVRVNLLMPWGEQFQVFSIEGHR